MRVFCNIDESFHLYSKVLSQRVYNCICAIQNINQIDASYFIANMQVNRNRNTKIMLNFRFYFKIITRALRYNVKSYNINIKYLEMKILFYITFCIFVVLFLFTCMLGKASDASIWVKFNVVFSKMVGWKKVLFVFALVKLHSLSRSG